MAKVIITLTDEDDGSVRFLIDKGEVAPELTMAQRMAFVMLDALNADEVPRAALFSGFSLFNALGNNGLLCKIISPSLIGGCRFRAQRDLGFHRF